MNKANILKTTRPTECDCRVCQSMCERKPCWPTPAEAVALMEAGHGKKLMLDYWEADEDLPYTEILVPAVVGYETGFAEYYGGIGVCTFFVGGRCQIHALKPIEGRLANHAGQDNGNDLHLAVARTWDSDAGRAAVARFKKEFFVKPVKP